MLDEGGWKQRSWLKCKICEKPLLEEYQYIQGYGPWDGEYEWRQERHGTEDCLKELVNRIKKLEKKDTSFKEMVKIGMFDR